MEKARLINCTFNEPPLADAPQTLAGSWKVLTGLSTTMRMSSPHRAGYRRALLYATSARESRGEIVDLGCGNGVIGLTLLDKTRRRKWCLSMNRRWRLLPAVER